MSNSVIASYRTANPQDSRSDEEIMVEYAAQYGAKNLEAQYPDFGKDYNAYLARVFPPTAWEYVKQATGESVRSLFGTVSSFTKGAAELGQALGTSSVDPNLPAPVPEDVTGISGAIERAGQAITPAPNPKLAESFLATKVPQAIGSTAGFAIGGLLTGGAGLPEWVGVAALGAASGASQGYEDAARNKATAGQALQSYIGNAIVGTSEALPIERLLHTLDRLSGGTLGTAVVNAAKSTLEEGLQEGLQSVAGNYIAQSLGYDPNRQLLDGAMSDAAAGGVSGAFLSLIGSAIGAKLRQGQPISGPGTAAPGTAPATAAAPILGGTAAPMSPSPATAGTPATPLGQTAPPPAAVPPSPAPGSPTVAPAAPTVAQASPSTSPLFTGGLSGGTVAIQPQARPTALTPYEEEQTPAPALAPDAVPVEPTPQPTATTQTPAAAAAPVPSGSPPGRPSWITENYNTFYQEAQNRNLVGPITDLAAQRLTAKQIAERLGLGQQGRDMVRAVREKEGIPDMYKEGGFGLAIAAGGPAEANPDFEVWVQNYNQAKQGNVGTTTQTGPPVEEAPAPRTLATEPQPWLPKTADPVAQAAKVKQEEPAPPVVEQKPPPPVEEPAPTAEELAAVEKEVTAAAERRSNVDYLKDVDLDNSSLKRELSAQGTRKTEEDEEALPWENIIDPSRYKEVSEAAFPVSDEAFTPELGERLTSDARSYTEEMVLGEQPATVTRETEANLVTKFKEKSRLITKRITFFKNSGTGQIVGLGTYSLHKTAEEGGKRYYAGPMPGQTKGQQIASLMANGWKPIYSLRLTNEAAVDARSQDVGKRYSFASQADFEVNVVQPANAWKRRNATTPVKAATAVFDEEGNRIETSGEAEEPLRPLIDALIQVLTGKPTELNVAKALLDIETSGDVNEIADLRERQLEALRVLQQSEQFLSLPPERQKYYLEAYVAKEVLPEVEKANLVRVQRIDTAGAATGEASAPGTQPRAAANRRPESPNRSYASGDWISRAFKLVLDRLAAAGVDVQVFQQTLDRPGFFASAGQGRVYTKAQQKHVVQLILADITKPTHEELITALHEAAHTIFRNESELNHQRIHQAIDALSDELLGITQSADPRIRQSNPAGLTADQLIEERLVEHLAMLFGGREQSQSIAHKLWTFVKDLMLRAGLFMQEQILGHTSPELVMEFIRNRMDQFLSGSRASDLFAFIGRKPSVEQKAAFYVPVSGDRWQRTALDEEGNVIVTDFVPETVDALAMNLAYRKFGTRYTNESIGGENKERKASIDVAHTNEIRDAVNRVFQDYRARHPTYPGTFNQFFKDLLEIPGALPDTLIARASEILAADGLTLNNPRARIADLSSQLYQDFAGLKTVKRLAGIVGSVNRRYGRAKQALARLPVQIAASNTKLANLLAKYQNADFLFSQMKDAMSENLKRLRSGFAAGVKLARRGGVLAQAIAEIEGRIDDPITRDYIQVIDRLAKGILGDRIKFYDLMQEVAQLPIAWDTLPLIDKGGVTGIRTLITQAAAANPKLAPLAANTAEGRALLAAVAAWARTNDEVLAIMNLKHGTLSMDRDLVKQFLQTIQLDMSTDLKQAAAFIPKLGAAAKAAQRLVTKWREVRAENKRLLEEEAHARTYVDLVDNSAAPILQQELARAQERLKATRPVNLSHNEKLIMPPSATATPAEVKANEVTFELNEKGNVARVEAWIKSLQDWLNGQTDKGLIYNQCAAQLHALQLFASDYRFRPLRQTILQRMVGSVSDWVGNLGTVAGRQIRTMVHRYNALITARFTEDLINHGIPWSIAHGDAKKAMGIKDDSFFFENFYYYAVGYVNSRQDLVEEHGSVVGQERALAALHSYYLAHPDLGAFVRKPGAWEALMKFYKATSSATDRTDKVRDSMGIPIEDDVLGFFRKSIGAPLFHVSRFMSSATSSVINAMQSLWTNNPSSRSPEAIAAAFRADPVQLAADLKPLFTDEVWENFVKPFANKPGTPLFHGRKLPGGTWILANPANIAAAFRAAGGDIVTFAHELWTREGSHGVEDEFVGETVNTLQNYFENLFEVARTVASNEHSGVDPLGSVNARVSEEWPPEFFRYHHYDQNTARHTVHLLAYHAAFGRRGSALDANFRASQLELLKAKGQWDKLRAEVQKANPTKSQRQIDQLTKTEATRRGLDAKKLEAARTNLELQDNAESKLNAYFASQSKGLHEMRTFMELMHFISSAMVQSWKSAFNDTLSNFSPLQRTGLNMTSARWVAENWGYFAKTGFGTVFQALVGDWSKASASWLRMQDLGWTDQRNEIGIIPRIRAIWASDRGFTRLARIGREVLNTPVYVPFIGGRGRHFQFRPFAPFTMLNQFFHAGMIQSTWNRYEEFLTSAIEYMKANPATERDPNFQFLPEHMGYRKEGRDFKYLKDTLNQAGMRLESLARIAIDHERKTGTQRLFTLEQYQLLASMIAMGELSLESNLATQPARLISREISWAGLLIGWSFRQMNAIGKSFREPDGERTKSAFAMGVMMLLATVPVGLAYGLLNDWWDEWVLGKKSNVRGFGTSSSALGALEQLTRIGIFGFWGDLLNTVGNYAGVGDLRGVSVDSRVVVINTMRSTLDAIATLAHQGTATYATVGRPLLQALGGGGMIQDMQIINHALGYDIAGEGRVTARINVTNWLRATGRELGMDVRIGRGGPAEIPNIVKPWITDMVLAAIIDDSAGFEVAYTRALEAAVELKDDEVDAAQYVMRAFKGYNPLHVVFQTKPDEEEYQNLLGAMPMSGASAVDAALTSFNQYAESLGARTPKKESKTQNPFRSPNFGRGFSRPTAAARYYSL